MTTTPKIWRIALCLSPVILVAGGFLAAIPWLKSMDDTAVLLLAAVAVTFVMGYAIYLEARIHRRLDEVQKAGAGFSAKWGSAIGQIVFVLLLLLPPFQALMTAIVNGVAADPGMTVDRSVVVFTMMLGFMGTVMLQAMGTIVMSAVWWARKR